MSTFEQLFNVTKQLVDQLRMPLPKEEREQYIEKLELLLDERGELIKQFDGQLDEDKRQLAQELVSWNKEINERLQANMNIIKIDINKLKKQKQTGVKYENPYEASVDGIFIDKKN